nr:hypothetical protein [Pyrobaculum arsenaticum]
MNKFEKKRKIDSVQELIILATYLNMQKLDEMRESIEGVLRAFQRLDALIDVVKELKKALDNMPRDRSPDVAKALDEVRAKLDQIIEKLETYTVEGY